MDDHQRKHIKAWPGSARTKGTQFPRGMTRDEFVHLLNFVVDSKGMRQHLEQESPKKGPVKDVLIQVKDASKYGWKGRGAETLRVQLARADAGWFFHMYPVEAFS